MSIFHLSRWGRRMSPKTKRLLQIIFLAAILFAIPLTFFLVQTVQDLRSRADTSTGGVPVGESSGCCHLGSEAGECQLWFGAASTCSQGNGACSTGWQCKGGSGQGGTCEENCSGKACGEKICDGTITCSGSCEKCSEDPKNCGCDNDGICESNRQENVGNCSDCKAEKSEGGKGESSKKWWQPYVEYLSKNTIEVLYQQFGALPREVQNAIARRYTTDSSCSRNDESKRTSATTDHYIVFFRCKEERWQYESYTGN